MEEKFMRHNNAVLSCLLVMLVIAVGAVAQQPTNTLMTIMAANAKELRQYTFKQRTETYHKGELKSAKIDEIHYNATGERVSIPLVEQKSQSEPHRRGPGSRLMAKKIEERQEEVKQYIERLMALTNRYLATERTRLQAAMAGAEVTTRGGTNEMRIVMRDYVKSGDNLTMTFDSATKRPTKTEVNTTLDDAPISIGLAFDQVHNGPSYPGRTVVRSDAKQLELRVFTYDYRLY
jgi:hypothetical protein